jgi:hypothetical protein
MRKALFLQLISMFVAMTAFGQSHGYVFIAPGGFAVEGNNAATVHMGFGGEGVFQNGVGVGGEIGYAFFNRGNFDDGFGLASLNASYHFNHENRLVPFVTGGYSLAFRGSAESFVNVGAGVNWWFWRRLGLKAEFRDHIGVSLGDAHVWGVRFGLTFR